MYLLSDKERENLKKYLWCKDHRWVYERMLWKKVQVYQKIFSYIPWVRTICICNSLAMNACHAGSDIDLFIITEQQRLWTARIYLTLLTTLLWLRKTKQRHAGTFCLSFFVSLDETHFSDIALENDIYFAYWLETLIPIINKNKSYEIFLQRNKLLWDSQSIRTDVVYKNMGFVWKCLKKLWDIQEYALKKIFLPKTQRSYEKLGKPFWVIISDSMLKFHNTDRRKIIRDSLIWKNEE